MLEKIIEIQNVLKKYKNYNIAIEYIGPLIGEFLGVDRLVIFKRSFDEVKKKSFLGYNYEWTKGGIHLRYVDDNVPKKLYIEDVFESYGSVARGNVLLLNEEEIKNLKDEKLRKFYKDSGIKSLLVVPIMVNNDLWGSLSLHSLAYDQNFNEDKTLQKAQVITNDLSLYLSQIESSRIDKIQSDHSFRMASLGKIAASIAHEINNPIFLIGGFTSKLELIFENGYDDTHKEDVFKCLEYIQKSCKRTTNIIEGLRLMSRPSSQEELEVSNICDLIQRSCDIFKDKLQLEKIRLVFEQTNKEFLIECKPGQISQVITNLLNNSFDAISNTEDDKWIEIKAHANPEHSLLYLSIIDSGKRPSPEIIKNMMEPFFTTKAAGKGTGLGLSICKEIINHFNGTFLVDQECENMKFDIIFPLLSLDEIDDDQEAQENE